MISDCMFKPRSVALVGASSDKLKHSGLAQRHLRKHGYLGRIFPVNRRHETVLGEKAYARIGDIGEAIDHAFIMLPTDAVPDALIECGDAGVKFATILSNGFAESGDRGRGLQERMLATAREFGMRLLGPNSLGVVNFVDRIALSVTEALSLPSVHAGRYSVISQSGGMMGALLSHGQARGVGFSRMVSTGNEADLTVGEIGDFLVEDAHTDAILLFLESVRQPERLEAMVRRSLSAGKPVVAFCAGRSALGEQLAAAHTGAISGSGAAMTAFLRDIGVVRVDMLETMLDIPPLLIGRSPATGRRASVMTTTGGGGGLIVDQLARHDITVIPPSTEVCARLAAKDITVGVSPLIDLTLAGTNANTYGTVLGELLQADHHDIVVAVVGASAQFRPDRGVEPIIAKAAGSARPLAVFLTPCADASFDQLRRSAVAAFRSAETCSDAVRAYLDWQAPRDDSLAGADVSALSEALGCAGGGLLDRMGSCRLITAMGLAQPQSLLLTGSPDVWTEEQLTAIAFPVVAKIVSADIAHKTEIGGVVVDIATPSQLRTAGRRMLADVARYAPDARIDGIEVQRFERGLVEVLLGYRRDPNIGPTVTVGIGGVLTELYRDFSTRLAPVSAATARAMVSEVRGLAAITGYRNLPLGDVDALVQAIEAMSRLALVKDPVVLEAEVNPLIVCRAGEGIVAVDALVVCARAAVQQVMAPLTENNMRMEMRHA
jgi:acetate---CoA ligase (ADP-forming)